MESLSPGKDIGDRRKQEGKRVREGGEKKRSEAEARGGGQTRSEPCCMALSIPTEVLVSAAAI